MPPVTPSRTRRRSYGRMRGPLALFRATTRDDAVHDVRARQLLHRSRRQLFLLRRRTVARKLVEHARVLRGNEHREILVRRLLATNDITRSKDTHLRSRL